MICLGLADDLAAQVDEHLRDVDPDRTHVEARTAQRRRERQRRRLLVDRVLRDPPELGGEDRPDRTGIDRTVRSAAGALVDRADVEARRAADAAKRLPAGRVREGVRSSVVEEDEMERLGSVTGRGRSCRKTSRSRQVGTSFSIPITVIRVSGSVRHIRPLPSDSTTTTVPVSATAKFAPDTATRARRNFSRRWSRAVSASSGGASVRSGGAARPTRPISSMKMSRISDRLRWMAGTRMCDGRSWPSWTIISARSVSQTSMPSSRSASFSSISWVAIDLTLTTSRAPVA